MRNLTKIAAIPLTALALTSTGAAADIPTPTLEQLRASLPQAPVSKNGVYIVRLSDAPVATYDGGVQGYKATRPKNKRKLNPNSKAVRDYAAYLEGRQDAMLTRVGGGNKLHSYKYTYNGFAASLTEEQAAALRKEAGVVSVVADELRKPTTISTSQMLELEAGIWSELGGKGNSGEGVIVGIIDSGIWPESESFSDRTGTNKNGKGGKLSYHQIPGWHGKCTPGEEFPASKCNQKLIGAQWFNSGYGGDAGVKAAFPYEFVSARDADGHGTHTASTAAGNADVPVVINGTDVGEATGMAPRARISAYKVCWGRGDEGGCFSSDSVAAIDQAVIDGVDVLNFSISGSQTSSLDPVEVAFLFAADAGVFVAASAGNSGPTASTVAHNSPWLTTVAAGTHDRGYEASVSTGEPDTYNGVSLGDGVGPADLVYAGDAGDVLCNPGALDSGVVSGKIVLCDRGAIARVDKSLAVQQAGGIGMILANTSPNSLNADFHSVPSIHVDEIDGAVLRAYSQTPGATAEISAGTAVQAEASQVAAFSSRGPALAHSGDLLKPDIMAPGVDIVAAVSPDGNNGESFGALSGTSMSSPHMAGLGALMKQAQPSWTPAMIKSAFMTTATTQTNFGNPIAGGAFDYGAGFVRPNTATDPGLVYNAGFADWFGFLCGTGELVSASCGALEIDPSDLNYPSIAIGSLAGKQAVTRTVTNVGNNGSYAVSVNAPAGIDVVVTPQVLNLAPGESATYTVEFTNVGAALNTWLEGDLTWSDGQHDVRSPIVLRAVELAAPAEVAAAGESGSGDFDVTFGYVGDYQVDVHGLVAATTLAGNVVDDAANDINTALGTCDFGSFPFACDGISWHLVFNVPGAPIGRVSLFDAYTDGEDDIDLYVWDDGFNFVGSSGSGTSAEQVDIASPSAPFYFVAVHGWQTDGSDANYTLFSWFPSGDAGNVTVTAPAAAVLGESATVNYNWSGLDAGMRYMGLLSHSNGSDEVGQTVLRVDTD